jgi:hypothetical protein
MRVESLTRTRRASFGAGERSVLDPSDRLEMGDGSRRRALPDRKRERPGVTDPPHSRGRMGDRLDLATEQGVPRGQTILAALKDWATPEGATPRHRRSRRSTREWDRAKDGLRPSRGSRAAGERITWLPTNFEDAHSPIALTVVFMPTAITRS